MAQTLDAAAGDGSGESATGPAPELASETSKWSKAKAVPMLMGASSTDNNDNQETPAVPPAAVAEAPAEAPAPAAKPAAKSRFGFLNKKGPKKEATPVEKFHSAVRWNKPMEELEVFLKDGDDVLNGKDARNGNQAVHLSAQNGHLHLLKWLVEAKADINCQNGKGQTPLHMSLAYDFDEQAAYLVEMGADKTVTNKDGHKAWNGIDGDKNLEEAAPEAPKVALEAEAALEAPITDDAMKQRVLDAFGEHENGLIDRAALLKVFIALGYTDAQLDQLVAEAKAERDGRVDYNTFVTWIFRGVSA